MNGFAALLRIELRMVWRTWHRWALPLVMAFLALLSVSTARFAPEIIGALVDDGLTALLPEATWQESYAQWMKNLGQIGIFVVIFAGAGATSQLITSGQASLLAVRPVSRAAQPLVAFLARAAVTMVATIISTIVFWAGTCALFDEAPAAQLFSSTALWLASALIFLAISAGLSAITASTIGSVGATIGIYLALAIIGAFPKLTDYSPAGILSAPTALAGSTSVTSSGAAVALPYASAAALGAVFLLVGMQRFARREL